MIDRVFCECKIPFRNSKYSNHLYSNFVHVYCLVYKERLNVSYRRFTKIAEDLQLNRLLGVKKVPHFTTIQKFLQKTSKTLFHKLVRACARLLDLNNVKASVDGTGFSNTNPSHYYSKRVDGVKVKNFTKTVLLTDNKTKLVLDLKTHSTHKNETLDFIPLVRQLKKRLSLVLADKGYDSMKNRKYCWTNNIETHIPLREWKQTAKKYGLKTHVKGKQRKKALKLFNPQEYRYRAIVESVNSAIKRTLGSHVNSRKPRNQQKQVTIKALTYNLEVLTKTIKLTITITYQTISTEP
ncbi:MAG: IS5 family transposase, partial [archaeon]